MNWQAGLFRLGLLAYAGWIIFVGWEAYVGVVLPNRAAAEALHQEQAEIETCLHGRTGMGALTECDAISAPMPGEAVPDGPSPLTFWPYIGWALAPLVGLLILWLGADWVGRGFKAPRRM